MNYKLIAFEVSALLIWLGLAVLLLVRSESDTHIQPLTLEALQQTKSEERWDGIFFQDQHVGYSVTRTSSDEQGSTLIEQRSVFTIATFGQISDIVTASAALIDSSSRLKEFDFFMHSGPVQISARGNVGPRSIDLNIVQNGERTELNIDVEEPPHVSLSLESVIRNTELSVGKRFEMPFFDPVTLSQSTIKIVVTGSEILETGEEAWWLQSEYGEMETQSLVATNGDILRQEAPMGISKVRMTRETAMDVPTDGEPVDLIAMSAVPLDGKIKNGRALKFLSVEVDGVSASQFAHRPPLQTIDSTSVSVFIPNLDALPVEPISKPDSEWLDSTLSLPASNQKIIQTAKKVIGQATNRREAIEKLNQFVFDHMKKKPVIGVPNGLTSLEIAEGDCNEHTALLVSLTRSIQIPSRIAVGLVYSDRTGPIGQFYYHAWAEVQFGEKWIPVDPTFGQFPADATHIKVVEGDLDRQVEIMGLIGRVRLRLTEQSVEHREKQ